MKRNNSLKWFLVVLITAWAIYSIYPPQGRPLIEQFQSAARNRDTNFTAIVEQARKLQAERPTREFANLRDAVGTNDITKYFPGLARTNEVDQTRATLVALQRQAAGKIRLGLDLKGGSEFTVGVKPPVPAAGDTNAPISDPDHKKAVLSQAVEVLRTRVDKFGVAEPVIAPVGENRIMIQLPGLSESDITTVAQTIQQAAFLEFRLVHPQSDELISQGIPAPGYERLIEKRKNKDGAELHIPHLVKKGAERGLTGKYVSRAFVTRDPMSGRPEIILRFDSEGANLFGEITRANVGRQLGIVLDGVLYSAPNIQQAILGGSASITGSFTDEEAFALANALENPLESPVEIEEQRTVDPSLGHDSIRSGMMASAIAAGLTFVFMVSFYFLSGIVACIALVLNILILLGVMASIGSTLTLPGIAGIALTIGMAVDANVLIFERLREELAAGKSLRGALGTSYGKAFGAIFDSNLTTLIASVVLMKLGTGPVQGFGVTLTIGVAASLFTALVVTRIIFDLMLAGDKLKTLKMLPIIKFEGIDFLKGAKVAMIFSLAVILVGVGYAAFVRGSGIFGVDFKGGDRIVMRFKEKVDVDKLRGAISAAGVSDAQIQYQKSLADQNETLGVLVPFNAGPKVQDALKAAFPAAGLQTVGIEKVGASVGEEIQHSALLAAIIALFGILVYVAFRYEFGFAVAAVVATAHDVLFTMGIFFLTGRELTAPMVAAVLTIIGYSINDKIVILDRIREDLKLGMRGSFKDIINTALNQTMSRTLITGGSVILATLALYIFGGGVINDFAFTFLVGVLAGTYSSIYIGAPIVSWWYKGQRPAMSSTPAMDSSVTARV